MDGAGYKVRIFEASTLHADDIQSVDSLAEARVRPMRKRLLVDLRDIDLSTVYNIEGMTWGPRLPTGERTLVLVGDDNVSADESTQVIALD